MLSQNQYMSRAIELAQMASGHTSPNPPVGAVLVKNDQIIGEGYTLPAGQDHAEIVALKNAGSNALGSELYVTLEPCDHFGRTPPCTRAIIDAGVRKVHIALMDPAPHTKGLGVRSLESAGIQVSIYEPTQQSLQLVEAFAKHITTEFPFVVAKFAMSLDGKIATKLGESQWISNEDSRAYAHILRSECDAVIVGIGTVIKDNPRLTARVKTPLVKQPLRVVLDSAGRFPRSSAMLKEEGETLIVVSNEEAASRIKLMGLDVFIAPNSEGAIDIATLLKELGRRGIVSVLIEGGANVLGSVFEARLVDKVVVFIAPRIIGGLGSPSPVLGDGIDVLANAVNLIDGRVTELNGDIVVVGYMPG